ncbi:MAG: methyl-accepting chemotaxis protein, partial [Myxococcaceae bacterium]
KDPTGVLRGYAFGTFDLSEIQKTVDRITRIEFDGRIYVMDRSGRALAHPDSAARTALRDLSGYEAFRSPGSRKSLRTGVDEAGAPLRTAAVTVDKRKAGWIVVVGWNPSELRVQAAQTEHRGAFAAILALLISVAAAFPLATWLTRPLSRIAAAAAAVGDGDLTQKLTKGSWWEPRETHLLVDSFESMLKQLRDLLRSLRASKEEMINTVSGLSQMMRAQTSLMERQTINLTELSTSARVVQEVSALSANRAEEVLVRAANADDLSAAGEHSVERSLQGLQEIRNQTNTIVTTIGALLERTLEIGEITERVKDLADQSNVVAFNAAIQAMRAGEFGRGFDVVAAEMRSLANRSIESTVRIREILSNAEHAIRSTAATTEDGGRKIQRGMEQIQESGSHLKELSLIVEVNSEGTKEIASAVKQQYSGILEISRGLDALEEAMRDTTVVFEGAEKVAEGLLLASERISFQVDAFRVE